MILYIIMDAFQALMEAARALCLYKLQNALIAGPEQWGMRDQNTGFVWNALTVVFILVFWSCSSQQLQGTHSAGPTSRPRMRSG